MTDFSQNKLTMQQNQQKTTQINTEKKLIEEQLQSINVKVKNGEISTNRKELSKDSGKLSPVKLFTIKKKKTLQMF